MSATNTALDLISAAQALAPVIDSCREESERERTLCASVIAAMVAANLHRIQVPRSLGGLEADPATFMRVVEEVAMLDGAAGWNALNMGVAGLFAARLPRQAAREIYGLGSGSLIATSLLPKGRAEAINGGYRLRGRWPLASGCLHASWLIAGGPVFDSKRPRLNQDGSPEVRLLFVPRAECEILDTWFAVGLRGTGSHDFIAQDVFVPEERICLFPDGVTYEPGPLYRGSIFDQLGLAISAVALGIARAALDRFADLAGRKVPARTASLLRDRTTVQAQLAQAEGLLRSARALVFETLASQWETLCAGEWISDEQAALKWLTAVHAATSCAHAVDIVYMLGGATSVYTACRMERCFRDIHVVTQHVAVSPLQWERAGHSLLGLGLEGR
jgi:indole-3-acetate monooxygenase